MNKLKMLVAASLSLVISVTVAQVGYDLGQKDGIKTGVKLGYASGKDETLSKAAVFITELETQYKTEIYRQNFELHLFFGDDKKDL